MISLHSFADAEMRDGDAYLACTCGAWFSGPPEQAVDAYRRHLDEGALPQTQEAKP